MSRKLWIALALLLSAQGGTVIASPCPPDDEWSLAALEKRYTHASTVFVGHLVRVEEAGVVSAGELLPSRPAVEATFQVVDVLKGHPPKDGKIRAPVPRACLGPLLLVGFDHILFLNDGNLVRSWGEAIFLYSHPVHPRTGGSERLLEALRDLSRKDVK